METVKTVATRKVGDIHSNGKWVWTEYKKGKFDWRTIPTDKKDSKVKMSMTLADLMKKDFINQFEGFLGKVLNKSNILVQFSRVTDLKEAQEKLEKKYGKSFSFTRAEKPSVSKIGKNRVYELVVAVKK